MKAILQYETLNNDNDWKWIAGKTKAEINWTIISNAQTPRLSNIKKPFLARYYACLRTVLAARRENAELIVVHGTIPATWVSILGRLFCPKTPILAFAYTIPLWNESSSYKKWLFRFGAQKIHRFLMFSSIETRTYPKCLGVDSQKFDMIHWSMNKPDIDQASDPIVSGRYISAVGGEGRDYKTLIEAMRELDDIQLAIVGTPASVEGIEIPNNVTVHTNIPYADAMNIMVHSEFTVLPLLDSKLPCGHGTLIAGLLLELPTIVTESEAMSDYGEAEKTVLTHIAQNPASLSSQITRLWSDSKLQNDLREAGLTFAQTSCSEQATIDYFDNYISALTSEDQK